MIADCARAHAVYHMRIHTRARERERAYNEAQRATTSAISHLRVNERTSRSNYAILPVGGFSSIVRVCTRSQAAPMSCGISLRRCRARAPELSAVLSARSALCRAYFCARARGSRIETNYKRGGEEYVLRITGSYYVHINLFCEILAELLFRGTIQSNILTNSFLNLPY